MKTIIACIALGILAACGMPPPDVVTDHGLELYFEDYIVTTNHIEILTEHVMEAMHAANPAVYTLAAMRTVLHHNRPRVFFVDNFFNCANSDGRCAGRYEVNFDDITVVTTSEPIYNTALAHEMIHFFRHRVGRVDEDGYHSPKFYFTFNSVENVANNLACAAIDQSPLCVAYLAAMP